MSNFINLFLFWAQSKKDSNQISWESRNDRRKNVTEKEKEKNNIKSLI